MKNFRYVLLKKYAKFPSKGTKLKEYKEVSREEIKNHDGNLGIMVSHSNITVIDIDFHKKDTRKKWNEILNGRELDTLTVCTPNGGIHLYFLREPLLNHRQNALTEGIDVINGDSNYIVAPPSKCYMKDKKTGKYTEELGSYEFKDKNKEIGKMPSWLRCLFLKDQIDNEVKKVKKIEKELVDNKLRFLNLDDKFVKPIEAHELEKYLNLLPKKYCENRQLWRNVLSVCKNYGYYEIFDKWSKSCKDQYDKDNNKKEWKSMLLKFDANYIINVLNKIIRKNAKKKVNDIN